MSERLRRMSDEGLGLALAELGDSMAFVRVDVAARVGELVSRETVAGHGPREPRAEGARVLAFPRARTLRRVAAAAVAAVMLFAAAAVAGRLGVPGLRIVFGPEATPSPHVPVGRNLFLGSSTTLTAARDRAGFAVYTPHGRHLGPASVYLGSAPTGRRVSLVYPPSTGLPRSRFTNAGLLITEFRARIDEAWVKKVSLGGDVAFLDVNGFPGVWFSGHPHEVQFVDQNGIAFQDSIRLAGNVLVWSENGVTIRLECSCTRPTALRIAGSMR